VKRDEPSWGEQFSRKCVGFYFLKVMLKEGRDSGILASAGSAEHSFAVETGFVVHDGVTQLVRRSKALNRESPLVADEDARARLSQEGAEKPAKWLKQDADIQVRQRAKHINLAIGAPHPLARL
jgi:hypothetical protein